MLIESKRICTFGAQKIIAKFCFGHLPLYGITIDIKFLINTMYILVNIRENI